MYQGFWYDNKRHHVGRFVWPTGKIEEREYEHDSLLATSAMSVDELSERLQQMTKLELQLKSAQSALATSSSKCAKCHSNNREMVSMPCMHLLVC